MTNSRSFNLDVSEASEDLAMNENTDIIEDEQAYMRHYWYERIDRHRALILLLEQEGYATDPVVQKLRDNIQDFLVRLEEVRLYA